MKIRVFPFIPFFAAFFLFLNLSRSFCEMPAIDEDRLAPVKTGIEEMKNMAPQEQDTGAPKEIAPVQQSAQPAQGGSSADKTEVTELAEVDAEENGGELHEVKKHMSQGVKYVPGKDHTGLCEDDDVYTHYAYEQDNKGRMVRKKGYNVGPNNTKVVSDEYLKYYADYGYSKKGKLIKDASYGGKGADNRWFTADDVESYHSAYTYCPHGKRMKAVRYTKDGSVFDYTTFEANRQEWIVKDVVYKGKGKDNMWLTFDDEIEKYHCFEYDKKGHLLRAMEYHVKFNGKGPDNIWFTADDVISSTKVFMYNNAGLLTQIKKFIAPGPDKTWFTDDDVEQYYTVYNFSDGQDAGTIKTKAQ